MLDGNIPKIDKNKPYEKQRTYFEKKGIVFLNDEWEEFIIKVWSNSLSPQGMGGVGVDPIVVYQYAEDNELNKSDTFDVIKQISGGVKYV